MYRKLIKYFVGYLFLFGCIFISSDYFSYNYYIAVSFELPKKKWDFATADIDDVDSLKWANNFKIVQVWWIDNWQIDVKKLKKKYLKDVDYLIAYNRLPAVTYYPNDSEINTEITKWLLKDKENRTLNPNWPFPHCWNSSCRDYYFNFGNDEVVNYRVNYLKKILPLKWYNWIFFDRASSKFILEDEYKSMLDYFNKKNKWKNYFDCVRNFYEKLHNSWVFIVTNQAFRSEEYGFLKYVDYDMVESYITVDKRIKKTIKLDNWKVLKEVVITDFYPESSEKPSLEDTLHYIWEVLPKLREKYKKYWFKNFIYMNYLWPDYKLVDKEKKLYKELSPKNAIYFAYAMCKLVDAICYSEVLPKNRKLEQSDVYFYDLWKVVDKNRKRLKQIKWYIRFYQNWFVLVSEPYSTPQKVEIESKYIPTNVYIYDAFNKKLLKTQGNKVILNLHYHKNDITQKFEPLWRIYIYLSKVTKEIPPCTESNWVCSSQCNWRWIKVWNCSWGIVKHWECGSKCSSKRESKGWGWWGSIIIINKDPKWINIMVDRLRKKILSQIEKAGILTDRVLREIDSLIKDYRRYLLNQIGWNEFKKKMDRFTKKIERLYSVEKQKVKYKKLIENLQFRLETKHLYKKYEILFKDFFEKVKIKFLKDSIYWNSNNYDNLKKFIGYTNRLFNDIECGNYVEIKKYIDDFKLIIRKLRQ